jgi:hypothetical protein
MFYPVDHPPMEGGDISLCHLSSVADPDHFCMDPDHAFHFDTNLAIWCRSGSLLFQIDNVLEIRYFLYILT